ncbi:MAG: RNA 2',3'-cyclic phosphodiesterase [Desulfosalsimonas sp.]
MGEKEKGGRSNADAGSRSVRAFIAAALPGDVAADLGRLQSRLKDFGLRMKYTEPENIHLTLRFLGDVSIDSIGEIGQKITDAAAEFARLELSARGLGVFPAIRRARVMWAGIDGQTDLLAGLQQEVEEAVAGLGFEREKKGFTGHLTLGRFKKGCDPALLAEAIRRYGDFASARFTVDALHLFESTLTPGGAVCRILSSHPLKGVPNKESWQ